MAADRQRRVRVHSRPVLVPGWLPRRAQRRCWPARTAGTSFPAPGIRSPPAAAGAPPRRPAAGTPRSPARLPGRRRSSRTPPGYTSLSHRGHQTDSASMTALRAACRACAPTSRPDLSRGFFLYGLSEDGGFDDVEESLPRRRSRSSSRAVSTASCASFAASCANAASSRASAARRSPAHTWSRSASRPNKSACDSASYPVTPPRSPHQPPQRAYPALPACRPISPGDHSPPGAAGSQPRLNSYDETSSLEAALSPSATENRLA